MGSRFLQSEPGLLLGQIASLVPEAAKLASRFVRNAALSLLSRFMAVARPAKKKSIGDAGSASSTEITSSFFATSGKAAESADFGSMFLAPPLAPRPTPRPRTARQRLRAKFRARHFVKPPWMC